MYAHIQVNIDFEWIWHSITYSAFTKARAFIFEISNVCLKLFPVNHKYFGKICMFVCWDCLKRSPSSMLNTASASDQPGDPRQIFIFYSRWNESPERSKWSELGRKIACKTQRTYKWGLSNKLGLRKTPKETLLLCALQLHSDTGSGRRLHWIPTGR